VNVLAMLAFSIVAVADKARDDLFKPRLPA